MKKFLCIFAAAIPFALGACSDSFSGGGELSKSFIRNKDVSVTCNYSDGAAELPEAYNSFSNQATEFELKLFGEVFSRDFKNSDRMIFSPVSSVLQLGFLSNGASGDTQSELILAFGGEVGADALNKCSSYFKSRMESVSKLSAVGSESDSEEKPGENPTEAKEFVSLSSPFFIDDDFDVKNSFLQSNADYYGNDIFKFDFVDSEGLKSKLTDYSEALSPIADNSGDLKDYSSFSVIDSDLLDRWLEGYSDEAISEGDFRNSDGKTVKATFQTSSEMLIHSSKAKGIIKYTKSNPLKFVAILPNEDISLDDYISGFDGSEYFKMLESMDITIRAEAKLPAFSVEAGTLKLSDALKACGINEIFSDKAELSGLSFSKGFKLNEITELTPEFELSRFGIGAKNENSKETSANESSGNDTLNQTSVEFDRPFLFLIIDNESNIPVFVGAVKAL